MKRLIGAVIGLACLGGFADTAVGAGEGLSGFQAVDIQVAVPTAEGSKCKIDRAVLRGRLTEKLSAAGIRVGHSALTLRAKVTTLSDSIAGRCISAIELDAFTAQTTVIQATRNSLVAEIPLWTATSIGSSDAAGHTERMGSAIAILADKFAAAFKANR